MLGVDADGFRASAFEFEVSDFRACSFELRLQGLRLRSAWDVRTVMYIP